ncbi:deoxynucleoside kinase [Chitinophaga rhizosphaerae]|uniref:deoxynucleoside kinase n=1 Tax=Chitinophaga rhizosphaerae TaxID=1864947 RepID=UPI000F813AD9|nr:deoxynucleoside kinase [Chitinophaga rhizosphaerae]
MQYPFITIEGNIGSGKTTLAYQLAEHYRARLVLEEFADNPFLPKFYADPAQYAFPLELFFMAERYKQLKDMIGPDLFSPQTISDYLFIKSLLFAKMNLEADEFSLYQKLFDIINPQLPQPDILIFLNTPVDQLQRNIRKRGRPYEQQIKNSYLERVQDMYMQFLRQYPMRTLMIDTTQMDFLRSPEDFRALTGALGNSYPPGIHYL